MLWPKAPDPLEELDLFGSPQPVHPEAGGDNADILLTLEEQSGHFHGEEENGEPLSACLATILNANLRCRPSSDKTLQQCAKLDRSSH
ncbi:hypothetical protein E2C01_051245 [Portunus trituberculatus]|uniref:Uncharacterized protein n=1 Tax=Portunus trituberculatus TaxID=210409 RepID=A0A5B7GJ21_PORTR|nr:hypothetical protein [Portunus trituberculatus]